MTAPCAWFHLAECCLLHHNTSRSAPGTYPFHCRPQLQWHTPNTTRNSTYTVQAYPLKPGSATATAGNSQLAHWPMRQGACTRTTRSGRLLHTQGAAHPHFNRPAPLLHNLNTGQQYIGAAVQQGTPGWPCDLISASRCTQHSPVSRQFIASILALFQGTEKASPLTIPHTPVCW